MQTKSIRFKPLCAEDIDVRVGKCGKDRNGIFYATLLLYKDARCDMRALDEAVGPECWQREHYECKGNLFCRVSIKLPDWPDWVSKSDCGSESNSEAEKGEASDSFKRACFNWGIGRELYTAPLILVTGISAEEYESRGKIAYRCKDRFRVTYMRVEDKKIVALNIENAKTKKSVYVFGDILPDAVCEVCGKALTKDFSAKSAAANGGHIYCSGTCKRAAEESR